MTHDLKTWLVRSVLAIKTQSLFHPESPGVRVNITRTRFGRWFKPTDFATIGEMVKHYRAKHRASAVSGSAYARCSGWVFPPELKGTMSKCIKCGSADGICGICEKCRIRVGSIPNNLEQFITLLRDAGWVARNDAQHTRIAEVWEILKPNDGGEGREPCERTSPPPCSASPVAQPPRDVSELYHELLYAVARKFPGESRHETALRYIRDTEERAGQAGSCKQNSVIDMTSTTGKVEF